MPEWLVGLKGWLRVGCLEILPCVGGAGIMTKNTMKMEVTDTTRVTVCDEYDMKGEDE